MASPNHPHYMRSPTLSGSRPLRYAAFFYLYVMQGIPYGFSATAIANHLAYHRVPPERIGQIVAMVGLPWTLQFVWGPVVDRFQGSRMGRRRPWVLAAQLLAFTASLAIVFITDPQGQLHLLGMAFLAHSVFASVQDTSVDALAISTIPEHERGRINAAMRGGYLAGLGLAGAAFSYLINRHGFGVAALTHSGVLLAMTAITFFIREKPSDALFSLRSVPADPALANSPPPRDLKALFGELWRSLTGRRNLLVFLSVGAVYLAASVFIRAFNVHLVQQLRWHDAELSLLSGLQGGLLGLAVIAVGGWLSDRVGAVRLLVAVMFVLGVFLLVFNLMAHQWHNRAVSSAGLVIWQSFDPAYSVAAMPLLMSICRKGIEGSQFTAYMALVNLCDVAGAYVSGHAQRWVAAPVLGVGCGLLVLAALSVVAVVFRRQLAGNGKSAVPG